MRKLQIKYKKQPQHTQVLPNRKLFNPSLLDVIVLKDRNENSSPNKYFLFVTVYVSYFTSSNSIEMFTRCVLRKSIVGPCYSFIFQIVRSSKTCTCFSRKLNQAVSVFQEIVVYRIKILYRVMKKINPEVSGRTSHNYQVRLRQRLCSLTRLIEAEKLFQCLKL